MAGGWAMALGLGLCLTALRQGGEWSPPRGGTQNTLNFAPPSPHPGAETVPACCTHEPLCHPTGCHPPGPATAPQTTAGKDIQWGRCGWGGS